MKDTISHTNTVVSAVIPCYNSEETILRAVKSLMDQTRVPDEVLIINDGSHEKCKAQLEKIASQIEIVRIIHQENQGLPGARNTGIQKSKGQYILMLDADDTFEPTFVKSGISVMEKRESIAVVTCGVARIVNDQVKYTYTPDKLSLRECLLDNIAPACALFKKDALLNVGRYDERFRTGYEDWDLNIRILKEGYTFEVIPEILFNYYDTEGSLLKTTRKEDVELRKRIVNKHHDLYSKHLDIFIEEIHKKDLTTTAEVQKIKQSIDYRVGNKLLQPARWIKNVFNPK